MVRKIIKIDAEKCNGCGACAAACHEGAIEVSGGKARLAREDYCDGLGDCLPECPCGAISFEEREAPTYDEAAVLAAKQSKASVISSQLGQWPCQIKLAPVTAPYFHGAELLVAADCTAYAYANIHDDFMQDKITLIGCSKLDAVDYSDKLTEIVKNNEIKSITVLRMEVPCCGGIEMAAKRAVQNSGKNIPVQVAIVSIKGNII
ncbi:MAG: 4Fe-4S dicluster domain-containing protein [Lachnospiraceae bacterium]|nr:4Fe-4S dicluster domain-containing protein [Lachnospiraceae bacterium]MDE7200664.1 4Fe-4S dicluster domain-containing protein [Lachnospiraceae bacterium]